MSNDSSPNSHSRTAALRAAVLLVEDDSDVRETTRLVLEHHGFLVSMAADGVAGLAAADQARPDVAVVDVGLPGMDGLTLTRRLAGEGIPVVLLTARDLDSDIVYGLDAGADDYLTKPFDGAVLAARLRAVLRRTQGPPVQVMGDLCIDRAAMTVRRGSELIVLTATEFRILALLLDHSPAILSRSQILAHVWGASHWGEGRVVDVNIQRIRAKLRTEHIVTLRGAGYAIREP